MQKITILLCLAMVVGLVACTSTGGTTTGNAASADQPIKPQTGDVKDSAIRLQAKDAKLETKAQLQTDGVNIGWWSKKDDKISWSLDISEAGEYTVIVGLSCTSHQPGSIVKLSVADKEFLFKVPNTGSWDTFKNCEIGKVTLEPGSHTLMLQATKIKDRFVCNVQTVFVQK